MSPRLLLLVSATVPVLCAAPVVTAVQNSASNLAPGLPNAAIAQGSIFVVYGTGLGPTSISTASPAFQSTTLSNTSVAVTVGSTTVNALMYYTSATQVAALLPSNTPAGAATFTVTYNGQASNASPQTVVANNPGIFTVDSSGAGAAIVTYADYSLVSSGKAANCGGPSTACGAANPGDTLILWATGLGPVSGNDAAGAGLGQNMAAIPLTLWLGGVQAPVAYQGRSGCCIGEDQIVFTVPDSVPTSCAVPLVLQIGNQVSNHAVIAVAKGSRDCFSSDPTIAVVAPGAAKVLTGQPVVFADIDLEKDGNGNGGFQDNAGVTIAKLIIAPGMGPFFGSFLGDPPLGVCIAQPNRKKNIPLSGFAAVDPGTSFTIKGPNGTMTVTGSGGQFDSVLSSTGAFLVPGTYTVTGTGGADVGPETGTTTIPSSATLTSPTLNSSVTLTRANGATFTWTGGSADALLHLEINSTTDSKGTAGSTVICQAPGNAGTLTIPAWALLALPPGNFTSLFFSEQVTNSPLNGTGIDIGVFNGIGGPTGLNSFTLK